MSSSSLDTGAGGGYIIRSIAVAKKKNLNIYLYQSVFILKAYLSRNKSLSKFMYIGHG